MKVAPLVELYVDWGLPGPPGPETSDLLTLFTYEVPPNQLPSSLNTPDITPPVAPHSRTILFQSLTPSIPTDIVTDIIRGARSCSSLSVWPLAFHLPYNIMAQITLVERRGRVGCAAYALHLGALGAGSSRFAAEALAAADGLPHWFGGGREPVQVGVDSVALAGSGESLDGSMLGA